MGYCFGVACGPRRIQYPHRVIEIYGRKTQIRCRTFEYRIPQNMIFGPHIGSVRFQIGNQNDLFDGRDFLYDGFNHFSPVKSLTAIFISIDSDQDSGVNLAESIEYTVDPKIGGTTRPNSSQTIGGEKTDCRFWNIREESDNSIAGCDAAFFEIGLEVGYLVLQGFPGSMVRLPNF